MPANEFVSEVTELSLILFKNKIDLEDKWAQVMYYHLALFDPNGIGAMPDYTFNVPTPAAPTISYTSADSEILVNNNKFSTCNPEELEIFWRWHRNFLKGAIQNYSLVYNP